jgi:hypothetical protein
MSSGFSTTGAIDESRQADQAECSGVAAPIFEAVEQRTVGAGVLSGRGDQREFVPTLAIDVEGFRDLPSGEHPNGTGG